MQAGTSKHQKKRSHIVKYLAVFLLCQLNFWFAPSAQANPNCTNNDRLIRTYSVTGMGFGNACDKEATGGQYCVSKGSTTYRCEISYHWAIVSQGKPSGSVSGRGATTKAAIDDCDAKVKAHYIAAAQACCHTNVTVTSQGVNNAQNSGQCASGFKETPQALRRVFDGDLGAYYCSPGGTQTKTPSGWVALPDPKNKWICKELRPGEGP